MQPGRGIAAFAVIVAGAGLIAFAAQKQRVEDAHWERSTVQTATVVSRDEAGSTIGVRMANGAEHELDFWYTSDYPIGEPVDVRVDGGWARLAWDPYDALWWYAGGQLVILLGVTLAVCHVWWRREVRRLERDPVPALAVTLVLAEAAVQVFPLGKGAGRRLLRFRAVTLWHSRGENGSADRGPGRRRCTRPATTWSPRVVNGILRGHPCQGAALTVQIDDLWLISESGVGSLTGASSRLRP